MNKVLALLALVAVLFVAGGSPAFAQQAPAGSIQVQRLEFPVTLADSQRYTMVGYLYTFQGNDNHTCEERRDTVQVLLHGGSYNHRYWDVDPINGVAYSYARYAAGECYSVLALDRLGSGESSRPNGDVVNADQDTAGVAQVLAALRSTHNPAGRKFKQIVLVGHSFGSFSAIRTLGSYSNLADALVVTGWLNAPGIVPLDPAVIQAALATPDVALPAEVRTALFYHLPAADPDVVAYDNMNLIDTVPRGFVIDAINVFTARALGDVAQIRALTRVDQVDVPVFVQLGDFDLLFPAQQAGGEAAFYSAAPSVTVDTLSNIGHSFNLHPNNQEGWAHITDWISRSIGN